MSDAPKRCRAEAEPGLPCQVPPLEGRKLCALHVAGGDPDPDAVEAMNRIALGEEPVGAMQNQYGLVSEAAGQAMLEKNAEDLRWRDGLESILRANNIDPHAGALDAYKKMVSLLEAEKTIFYQGVPCADVADNGTQLAASAALMKITFGGAPQRQEVQTISEHRVVTLPAEVEISEDEYANAVVVVPEDNE